MTGPFRHFQTAIFTELSNRRPHQELLRLNAVGNICKAFLKEAEVTETETEEGETVQQVKEKGLHYWVASDKKLHGI
jgi:hypothetical protein